MLSIEITRECPLSCPECDPFGDAHLGGVTDLKVAATVGMVVSSRERNAL